MYTTLCITTAAKHIALEVVVFDLVWPEQIYVCFLHMLAQQNIGCLYMHIQYNFFSEPKTRQQHNNK